MTGPLAWNFLLLFATSEQPKPSSTALALPRGFQNSWFPIQGPANEQNFNYEVGHRNKTSRAIVLENWKGSSVANSTLLSSFSTILLFIEDATSWGNAWRYRIWLLNANLTLRACHMALAGWNVTSGPFPFHAVSQWKLSGYLRLFRDFLP